MRRYGLSEEEGVRVLDMVRDAGAHGIFYWGSRYGLGHEQAGDPNSNAFAAIRAFLTANDDGPAAAPGPATFLWRE
jgi:hypothetical protein